MFPNPLNDTLGLVGQKLGPYVVLETSSIGGFAVVYRGEHEALHSEVAVKVLTPDVAPEDTRQTLEQLFLREAQILSQLRSEDILRAHDHGRTLCPADGIERPYMVVDFLRGKTLEAEIEERRVSGKPYALPEILELLAPIARALDVAHASGIIHRDVNPRNIFLEERADRSFRAKLIDFGFAKTVSETSRLTVQSVTTTLMARSPDYSAPEHYDRQQFGELSEMTDLYTLALVLVEAITFSTPLRGATPEALFRCTANRNERPSPRARGARVSDEVEGLFLRALAVDQFDRPHSVLAWWQELEQVARKPSLTSPIPQRVFAPRVIHAPESVPPEIPGVSPGRWLRRIGWTIFVLVLLGGGAAAAVRFAPWPIACPPNMADCNRRAIDGCETRISTSLADCGGCDKACPTTNAVNACIEGKCTIQNCTEASHKDCNSDPNDGCEVDISTDLAHCGECGRACANVGAKRVACVNAACQVICERGRADCDGKPETGCETTLASDPNNCGHCGISCRGTSCDDGFCTPKPVATVKNAEHLAIANGKIYFYNRDAKQIQRVTLGAEPEVVVDKVSDLVSLAAGADVVVWSGGKPAAAVFAAPANAAASPTRIAALPKAVALAVDASGNFVSWPQRLPAPGMLLPLDRGNAVATARLEASLITAPPAPTDCKSAVGAFAGDADQRICCAPAGPIVALTCQDGNCKPERYSIKCPEQLTLDENWLYWTQDVRVVALDRKSGEIRQVSRRAKMTRELAFGGDYVYWLEGNEASSDVLRTKRPVKGSPAAAVEVIAKNQGGVSSLAADSGGVYWTRKADDGVAIVTLGQ